MPPLGSLKETTELLAAKGWPSDFRTHLFAKTNVGDDVCRVEDRIYVEPGL